MSGEFGTGKTIFVLAIVVGCFAVLWPKIFYPMLTASVKPPTSGRQVGWQDEANVLFLNQLCYLLEENQVVATGTSGASGGGFPSATKWSGEVCLQEVRTSCGVQLTEELLSEVRLGKDKSNLTNCLANRYALTPAIVAAAAPPRVKPRPYIPQSVGPHARPERPAHLYPEMMHPALREKGRAMPQRTIDKQARPGPMPGVRPPMGGAGGIVPPPQQKGSGAMGIIMPLYTVGIVVFFVYTIMKVLFKKGQEDDTTPKLKDFGLDPEYRKYVFAEEYLDNADVSTKDQMRRQAREESRSRKKTQQNEHQQQAQQPETKIEDEQLDQLRRRLEETEKAMERLMCQMGSVTDKLTAAKITEVLSQAQAQAKILKIGLDTVMASAAVSLAATDKKEEVGEMTSEEDLTSSEALTTTMSEETSLPTSLQRHLEQIQVEQLSSYSELLAEVGQLPMDVSLPLGISVDGILPQKGVTGSLDVIELEGAHVGAPALGELIPGERTVIKLQELKDDDEVLSPQELKADEVSSPEELKNDEVASHKELKDDEVSSHEEFQKDELVPPEEVKPVEVTSNEKEMEVNSIPLESQNVEAPAQETMTQDSKTTEEKKETLPEGPIMVSEAAQLSPSTEEPNTTDVVVQETISTPAEAIAVRQVSDDIRFIDEALDEDKVVEVAAPAAKETTPKPISEPPVAIARELSSEPTEEGSSEATETGADISDLHSFAEEDQVQGQAVSKENVEVKDTAEPNIAAPMNQANVEMSEASESVCKGQGTQTSFAFPLPTPLAASKEDSTQTEKEQEVTVLALHTSFRHDEGGVETKAGSHGPLASQKVTEILLDALLPSETQLLVTDSQVVGSSRMHDIEIEASETGAVPCVVTSNVSLAFLGLEQRDDITPSPTNNSILVADGKESDTTHKAPIEIPSREAQDLQIVVPQPEVIDEATPCELLLSCDSPQEILDLEISAPQPKVVLDSVQCESSYNEAVTQPQSSVPQTGAVPKAMSCEVSPFIESPLNEIVTQQQSAVPESLPCELSPSVESPVNETVKQLSEELAQAPQETESEVLPKLTEVSDQIAISDKTLPEKEAVAVDETLSDIEKLENQVNSKVALAPERIIGEQLNDVLPRPSSPLPPHVPDNDREPEKAFQEEEEERLPRLPVSPSLEAIAEAVAAASTRAALEVLATAAAETCKPKKETQSTVTRATFLTDEIPTDQSPISTDESSSATTVVAVSDIEDAEVPKSHMQNTAETLANGVPAEPSTIYVATVSHTPSASPSSTPEADLSGETVEAALAEAAQEELINSSMAKSTAHEQPATQGESGATTVIPKNEESPTSSKGSSPDMDEYEVIAKDEDHSTTATKAKCLRKETATAKSEVKKIQIPIKKPEELEEEEEEVKEEEEEVEEEVETEEVEGAEEEVHKKGNERQTAESAKTKTSTQEMLDEE